MHQACLKLFDRALTPEEAVDKLLSFERAELPDKIKEAVKDHEKCSAG